MQYRKRKIPMILKLFLASLFLMHLISAKDPSADQKAIPSSPNGITFPYEYTNWRIIAPSQRTDNNTIRVVLGNDVAINAAKTGKTKPWPDGTVLVKIVWKAKTHEKWQSAIIPDEFVHIELMIKDSKRYTSTGGWGFARWIGNELKPYGKDPSFVYECFGCHTPVKEDDYVFTRPVKIPY